MNNGSQMNIQQRLLLETLSGHFAWLKAAHPRKANTSLAKKAHRAVQNSLRMQQPARVRKAA